MSHEPPVPAANRSPYPIVEPPHAHKAAPAAEGKTKKVPPSAQTSSGSIVRLGAAVALGVGATVAALLFARRTPEPAKAKPAKKQRKRAKAD